MPKAIKNGLAVYRGGLSAFTGAEGATVAQPIGTAEREYLESKLRHQRAYDSVDILSNGKSVDGFDLNQTPTIAGIIDGVSHLVGVRPDCVHATMREGGQMHTSHSDKMRFDIRSSTHMGADALLHGQIDRTKSTGDFIISSGGLAQPLRLPMHTGCTYLATEDVLHAPFLHGVTPPDQASWSLIGTWSPGKVFNLFRRKPISLAKSFGDRAGVGAVDGEEALEVTTTSAVPPKHLAARVRPAGDFTPGSSLFRGPPEDQGSDYHRLGTVHGATGGMT